jgi:excisionase family DNA binding protein
MHAVTAEREWLRAEEAAALLGVSPKTISRWTRQGKVPCFKTLGGHRRFDRTQIEEIAERMKAGG